MKLSNTELYILQAIARGEDTAKDIARSIKRSYSQTTKALKNLEHKKIISNERDHIVAVRHQHIVMLLQELSEHENLPEILSNSGIPVIQKLINTMSAHEVAKKTGLSRQMVHRVLRNARKMSIIIKHDSHYVLNGTLWPRLNEFFLTLNKYEDTIDERLPPDAIIYHKDGERILFSSKKIMDTTPAAFSAFKKFDMKVLLTTNYYIIPSTRLTARTVLRQCLWVLESKFSVQLVIFTAIFSEKTGAYIQHPIMKSIQSVLAGRQIKNYPSRSEIAERAELYGVQIV